MRWGFGPGSICVMLLAVSLEALGGDYSCGQPRHSCDCSPGCCQQALEGDGAGGGDAVATDMGGPSASLAGLPSRAGGPGYIDSAIVGNNFRVRYDDMLDADRPDRAEFFYSRRALDANGIGGGLHSNLSSLDMQELSTYLEVEVCCGWSAFIEVPYRWIEPSSDVIALADDEGFSDINFGFRCALVDCCGDYLTFQLRVYSPTGDDLRGLGNGHTTIEPGLLAQRDVACDARVFGELKLWIPTDGTVATFEDGSVDEVAGSILRYGVGGSYDVWHGQSCCDCCECATLSAVVELVGWTVLDGGKTNTQTNVVENAEGDTIINIKLGARYTSGPHTLYAGWGHALTEEVWYEDLTRIQYEYAF